ncbi:unnamed protein product [Phytomonas sp. Hart1]|nr:unnamed protein product [Phytomonas sp. Hart1]|eukprot:CCW71030.1 unnamed protein product [Phytomonas sp. isolate Hart1]
MPRCIECEVTVERIINVKTNTVEKCPCCGLSCDTYYEFGTTQKWIDAVLLQRSAWVHILFNEDVRLPIHLAFAIACCFIEAFVVRSFYVITSFSADTAPTLQIVKIVKGPLYPMMNYATTLPKLFSYALSEHFLLLAAMTWVGSRSTLKGVNYEQVFSTWVKAISIATSVKLLYCLFFIWNISLSLLWLIDGLFCVWIIRGFLTLMSDKSLYYVIPRVLLCIGCRVLFRHLTGWCSQIIM